jgi:hypothetical protein
MMIEVQQNTKTVKEGWYVAQRVFRTEIETIGDVVSVIQQIAMS